jgi:type IV pilus assembly protein PilM
MRPPRRIVTLNLGSQTVSMAEFVAQPFGGLLLNRYLRRELPPDAAGEPIRNHRLTELLVRDMMDAMRLRGARVNYAIAAHSVFTRFIKLPAVEQEKIERLIAFEAQQNVPFPIDEVVWDYQLVGGGADEQIQVVLVAVKADMLDGINTAVEAAGLRTNIVGMATMGLYNSFRYNYPKLDGCSLLIDIGARTTNLLFIESGKIFSRSVAIGGSSVTTAIAKEFQEPIVAAEFRKLHDGFVSLGGAFEEPADPDVARVAKIMRTTMTRLHSEIMRSVSHYRAQQQGSAPMRVFLSGGGATTRFMREFFWEKLHLPVELFDPLRNVGLTEAVDAAEIRKSAHSLGELVGLALRSVTTCPMELNLRPASVVARQQLERRRPFFALAAACAILGILGWGIYFARAAQVEQQASDALEKKIDGMRKIETPMAQVRKQTAALDAVATPLIAAINDRSFWPEVLEDLNARLPKEFIWITELVATSGGKPLGPAGSKAGPAEPAATPAASPGAANAGTATIDGLLVRGLYMYNPRQQEVVVDFFKNLVQSPFFAIDPNNQAKTLKPTTPTNTEWAFPYELRLDLKKPVKLP